MAEPLIGQVPYTRNIIITTILALKSFCPANSTKEKMGTCQIPSVEEFIIAASLAKQGELNHSRSGGEAS